MGRYLTSAINASGANGGVQALTTTATAGEAIQANDLLVLGTDNLAYFATDPSVPANFVRPPFNPNPVTNAFMNPTPSVPAGAPVPNTNNAAANLVGVATLAGAPLSNGNFIVAWMAADSSFIQFAIFNQSGEQQGATVNIDAVVPASISFNITVTALIGGGFVLAFCRNVAPWCQYAVYSNSGAVVKALATVNATIATATATIVKSIALSSGGFTLAYYAPSIGVRFCTYDATGASVSGHILIDATAGNYVEGAAFTAAQGGGFVLAYGTSATGTKVQKINNAGAFIGSPNSTGSQNFGYSNVCVLIGGGYAVVAQPGPGKAMLVSVFKGDTTLVGTQVQIGTAITQSVPPVIVPLSTGDCAVAATGNAGNTPMAYVSGTTGALLKTVSYSTLPLNANSNSAFAMAPTKSGGVSVIAGGGGGTYSSGVFDANAQPVNPVGLVPAAYQHLGSTAPLLFPMPNQVRATADFAIYVVGTSAGLAIGFINILMQKLTPLGVATASAAKASAVPVQVTGNATTRLGFAQPYAVDANGVSPPGQRMSIMGNQALLNGVQSVSRRQIN